MLLSVRLPAIGCGYGPAAALAMPSWPASLLPQHQPAPVSCSRAQVWRAPALTSTSVRPRATSAGAMRCAVVESPSWPESLRPQQYVPAPKTTAQVWWSPALIGPKAWPPATATGVELAAWVPLPSWPYSLSPQQYVAPAP